MAEQHLDSKIKAVTESGKPLVVLLKGKLSVACCSSNLPAVQSYNDHCFRLYSVHCTHTSVVPLDLLPYLLAGHGSESLMVESIIRTTGLSALREQTTLFVLSTSEAEAKTFKPVQKALSKAGQRPLGKDELPLV